MRRVSEGHIGHRRERRSGRHRRTAGWQHQLTCRPSMAQLIMYSPATPAIDGYRSHLRCCRQHLNSRVRRRHSALRTPQRARRGKQRRRSAGVAECGCGPLGCTHHSHGPTTSSVLVVHQPQSKIRVCARSGRVGGYARSGGCQRGAERDGRRWIDGRRRKGECGGAHQQEAEPVALPCGHRVA